MTARSPLVVGSDGLTQQLQSGDALTGFYSQSDVDAKIAAVSGGAGIPDAIVSGCGVAYSGAGLTFNMSAGSFYIDNTLYSAAAQSVTLSAADATNPRIDVLYLDSTGTFGKITGTAAASPSQPSIDPTTQFYLTFVLVPAAATSLSGITNETIYDEGTEWIGTAVGSGFNIGSTTNPYSGAKCVEGTTVTAGSYAKFVRSSTISFDGDGNLTFRIQSKALWNTKRWLTLQWYSGGIAKGSAVNLKSGTFGFDSSQTSAYQLVIIPKTQFAVPAGTVVDELRIVDAGGSIGFYIDALILQNVGTTSGSGAGSGITQTQADARYAQLSKNLSDLPSPPTARGNLGLLRLIAFFFTTTPTGSEVLALYVAADAFTIPANMDGSQVKVGTNATATFAVDVQLNGTSIGTISIATSGTATLTTASGTSKSIAVGDVIQFVAPSSADASIANVAVNIKGML